MTTSSFAPVRLGKWLPAILAERRAQAKDTLTPGQNHGVNIVPLNGVDCCLPPLQFLPKNPRTNTPEVRRKAGRRNTRDALLIAVPHPQAISGRPASSRRIGKGYSGRQGWVTNRRLGEAIIKHQEEGEFAQSMGLACRSGLPNLAWHGFDPVQRIPGVNDQRGVLGDQSVIELGVIGRDQHTILLRQRIRCELDTA